MMELTGNRMDAIGVVRSLRQEIEAGTYRLGDRLPAERQLAARILGVSGHSPPRAE